MRRALCLLALAGCFDWTTVAPTSVDAGGDASKDGGDGGVEAEASLPCNLAARRHDALLCDPTSAKQCDQSIVDECGCPVFVASLASDPTKAYQLEMSRCTANVCAPCAPGPSPWTCKDDGTGTFLCAP